MIVLIYRPLQVNFIVKTPKLSPLFCLLVNGAWPSSESFLLARHPDWILLFFWPRFLAEKRRADLDCLLGPIHVKRLNILSDSNFFFLISGKILKIH